MKGYFVVTGGVLGKDLEGWLASGNEHVERTRYIRARTPKEAIVKYSKNHRRFPFSDTYTVFTCLDKERPKNFPMRAYYVRFSREVEGVRRVGS